MAKRKLSEQKGDAMKQSLYGIKSKESVNENKNLQLKTTPMKKVNVMNNSKEKKNNAVSLKLAQKDTGKKNNENLLKTSWKQSKGKQCSSMKETQNSKSKIADKKINLINFARDLEDSDTDDSDFNIDEGIVSQSDIGMTVADETFENEEDENDQEFDNIEKTERKGVKMFKGMKPERNAHHKDDNDTSFSSSASENDIIEEVDDDKNNDTLSSVMGIDEIDQEDDDDGDESKDSMSDLKVLLGNSIVDDDSDEDFNEEEEDDEDDDISDDSADETDDKNEDTAKMIKISKKNSKTDKSAEREKRKQLTSDEEEEINKRTIFIDNVPKETKAADVKKVFCQFGPINNLRFRGIIPKDPKMSKKLAAIKNYIHPKVTTVTVYVNYKSEESAKKALEMNGKIFQGNYIHVRIVADSTQDRFDSKKAVFLGNLKFDIDKNSIWKCFGECGDIESVYLIRDPTTGQTKGSGYVNFKTEEAATLALKLDGVEILNRPIRVRPYLSTEKRQERDDKKKGKKRDCRLSDVENNKIVKKFKSNLEKRVVKKSEIGGKVKKEQQESEKNHGGNPAGKKQTSSFQGEKANVKNKKKSYNKLEMKKKKMAEKLVMKSKVSRRD